MTSRVRSSMDLVLSMTRAAIQACFSSPLSACKRNIVSLYLLLLLLLLLLLSASTCFYLYLEYCPLLVPVTKFETPSDALLILSVKNVYQPEINVNNNGFDNDDDDDEDDDNLMRNFSRYLSSPTAACPGPEGPATVLWLGRRTCPWWLWLIMIRYVSDDSFHDANWPPGFDCRQWGVRRIEQRNAPSTFSCPFQPGQSQNFRQFFFIVGVK